MHDSCHFAIDDCGQATDDVPIRTGGGNFDALMSA